MASYQELKGLVADQTVREKVQVAIADVAVDVLGESPTTVDRQNWAKSAIADPAGETPALLHYVLITNKAFTQAQIQSAADSTYKTNIASAVTAIYGAAV